MNTTDMGKLTQIKNQLAEIQDELNDIANRTNHRIGSIVSRVPIDQCIERIEDTEHAVNRENAGREIPTTGYVLPKWGKTHQYRATAIAYMEREEVESITHLNEEIYSMAELKAAAIKAGSRV